MDLVENGNHSHIQQSSEKMQCAKCRDSKASVPNLGQLLDLAPWMEVHGISDQSCQDAPHLPSCTIYGSRPCSLALSQTASFLVRIRICGIKSDLCKLLRTANERLRKKTDRKIEDTFRTPCTFFQHSVCTLAFWCFFAKWNTYR